MTAKSEKKKFRRGYTLVELIVVTAISAMIFVGLITIQRTSLGLTLSGEHESQAQNLAKTISQTLDGVLRYANTADVQKNLPQNISSQYNYIYLENGSLKRMYWGENPEYLLGSRFLDGYSCDIEFKKNGLDIMCLTVTVFYDGEQLCRLNTDVFMQNLMDASITGEEIGKCICYKGTGITVNNISIYSYTNTVWEDGAQLQFYATTYPRNASTRGVAWSVSDETVASIDQNGLLTPVKDGSVYVIATALDGSLTTCKKYVVIKNQF